eukprot:638273-Amphidinium_carterae.1
MEPRRSEATHIYIASLCFNEGMLARVAEKLAREARQLIAVATLLRFPGGAVNDVSGALRT